MSVAYGQYYPIVATNTAAAAACPYFCTCKPTIWQCSSSSSMTWPLDNQPHVIVRGVKMLDMTGSDVNVLPNWRPTHNFPDLQLIFLVNTIFDGYQCRELECLEKLGLKIIAPRCGKDKRNGCAYAPCCPWSSRPTPTGFPTPWPLPYPPKVFTTTHAGSSSGNDNDDDDNNYNNNKASHSSSSSSAPLLDTSGIIGIAVAIVLLVLAILGCAASRYNLFQRCMARLHAHRTVDLFAVRIPRTPSAPPHPFGGPGNGRQPPRSSRPSTFLGFHNSNANLRGPWPPGSAATTAPPHHPPRPNDDVTGFDGINTADPNQEWENVNLRLDNSINRLGERVSVMRAALSRGEQQQPPPQLPHQQPGNFSLESVSGSNPPSDSSYHSAIDPERYNNTDREAVNDSMAHFVENMDERTRRLSAVWSRSVTDPAFPAHMAAFSTSILYDTVASGPEGERQMADGIRAWREMDLEVRAQGGPSDEFEAQREEFKRRRERFKRLRRQTQ
ncbi:uncharacterized protein LOC129597017 [Paramacrobiotus metropolitanus]|uniref:uncharacterized protein LOC129597017 n=1 Tax=Paramacrobiotus metropolitanus TaxID=2943436 RepID=UPI002445962B|nr:uncharacterized protein LOC129597017 [Paramacrobiotus metropolitanus]